MEANDIAIITLKTAVKFTKTVQPVCIDPDPELFERQQFIKGAVGKIVGWDIKRPNFDDPPNLEQIMSGEATPEPEHDETTPNFEETKKIKIQSNLRDTPTIEEVRIVPIEECVAGELQYISKDVICGNKTIPSAYIRFHLIKIDKQYLEIKDCFFVLEQIDEGYYAPCKNYLGRGLVFEDPKTKQYYLRGIASLTGFVCAETSFFPYTRLSYHKELVEKYIDDCEGGCRRS